MVFRVTKVKVPTAQVHVDNTAIGDGSGYLGLILNVNESGKAIRIALRDGTQRVHILKQDVADLKAALDELVENGKPMSKKDVVYDKGVKNDYVARKAKRKAA